MALKNFTVTTVSNIDAYFAKQEQNLQDSTIALVDSMSASNVDLTLLGKPALSSKRMTIGGKQLRVDVHCDILKNVAAVFQIWNGSKSILIVVTNSELNDARFNHAGKPCIAANDRLSQAVAAFRIKAQSPIEHQIAMKLAYEYKQVDGSGCHAVWD